MKIAIQIVSYYPVIAGAEVFAQRVAEHMAKKGNKVDVITLREKPGLKKHETINGVEVYRVKPLKIHRLKLLSAIIALTRKTLELDRKENYDIIHSHLVFSAGQAGTIVKKLRNTPNLLTTQGGDLVDYSSEDIAKFSSLLRPLISWSLRNADIVHAVSKYCKEFAEQLGAKRVVIIPNGVDVDKFKPLDKVKLREKYGFSEDEKIIISTSRLTPKNGMHILIKAIARLPYETKQKLKVLILGEGHQRWELENLINKLSLDNTVCLLGYVPHEKLPEYLNLADIFCRPSLDEGFGISFIEAMACKLPVIGTPVGGILDIIEDRKTGLFVKPNDDKDLAEKLSVLISDTSLREELAKRGYETVHKKFTWDIVLKEMEKLYKEVVR